MLAIKNILANSRVKSFLWRTGMMILAVVLVELMNLVPTLDLPTQVTVILGLILGEVSKMINNILQGK
jgi:hypothetical protein